MAAPRQHSFEGEPPIDFRAGGGQAQRASGTWYRGEHCNFNPTLADLEDWRAAAGHVLHGWLPPEPRIDRETRIVAFGSCFAAHIAKWLAGRRYDVLTERAGAQSFVVRCGEGLVNSFVIRDQFEWAWRNRWPDADLWHGKDAELYRPTEAAQAETAEIFDAADVFVITLGLSEIWYDKPTGGVFWRAVPAAEFEPERHCFKVSTVAENYKNLKAVVDLIGFRRPEATIILTLSPIPLVATFRPVSCIAANAVSKATLRVAIDTLMRNYHGHPDLFYWPSYELVTELFPNRWMPDRRHIKPAVLNFVMRLFERHWCVGAGEKGLDQAWSAACRA